MIKDNDVANDIATRTIIARIIIKTFRALTKFNTTLDSEIIKEIAINLKNRSK
jgi:hypothetical protein